MCEPGPRVAVCSMECRTVPGCEAVWAQLGHAKSPVDFDLKWEESGES